MKKQSEAIEVSGSDLVEEMKQLKDKVQEVTGITQDISAISKQTNMLALNASIEKSVQATEEQKNLILQNTAAFQEVKAQSGVASLKASELSGEVSNLMKANNKIVENIEQLSAVSEEVSENAQQASGLSNENIAQIKEAVQKVMCINDIIMELKKYQEK